MKILNSETAPEEVSEEKYIKNCKTYLKNTRIVWVSTNKVDSDHYKMVILLYCFDWWWRILQLIEKEKKDYTGSEEENVDD